MDPASVQPVTRSTETPEQPVTLLSPDAGGADQAKEAGDEMRVTSGADRVPSSPAAPKRLASLDAFRGLTIIGMLLVNNMALDTATPSTLTHARWNQGVHFADFIYPWFLLIVGVAIPYSAASHRKRGMPLWRYDLKAVTRGALLVLLGCLVNSSMAKHPLFDLGVLQLIGLAYTVGALLYVMPLWPRLGVAAAFLIGHWAAIRFVAIPGVGAGVFTESQNLIARINQTYLEPVGLAGIVSTVPTSAMVLIGTGLGDILRRDKLTSMRKVAYLLVAGAALALAGWLWSLDLPFNKPVWTASYILYTAGCGAALLGLFYLLVDIRGWRPLGYPFVVAGTNAIFAYVAPILVKVYILRGWTWTMPDGSHLTLQRAFMHWSFDHLGRIAGGWLYTISYIAFWWLILLWMYRKRILLRV
jgi:predicted acyltransferase